MLLLWGLWVLLLLWVQASIQEQKPFDPFEILGIDHTATDKEIKRAYRQLSLKYHPDKVGPPAARAAPLMATQTRLREALCAPARHWMHATARPPCAMPAPQTYPRRQQPRRARPPNRSCRLQPACMH